MKVKDLRKILSKGISDDLDVVFGAQQEPINYAQLSDPIAKNENGNDVFLLSQYGSSVSSSN